MAASDLARMIWLTGCLITAGPVLAQSDLPQEVLKPRLLPVAPIKSPPPPTIAELDLQGSDPIAAFKPRLLPIPVSATSD